MRRFVAAMVLVLGGGCGDLFRGEVEVRAVRLEREVGEARVIVEAVNVGNGAAWVRWQPFRVLHDESERSLVIAVHDDDPIRPPGALFTPVVQVIKLHRPDTPFTANDATLEFAVPDRFVEATDAVFVELGWYASDPGTVAASEAPADGIAIGDTLE